MSSPTPTPFAQPIWLASHPVAVVLATGADAVDLLNRLGTQDVRHLDATSTRFGLFVTHQGKLVAQVRVIKAQREEGLWLITDPLMGKPLVEWLEKYTITEDASFRVLSESWSAFRFVGGPTPEAGHEAVRQATAPLAPLDPVSVGLPRGWGAALDVLVPEGKHAKASLLLEEQGLSVVSGEERERARLHVGEPALGHDIAPLSQPLEWRLGTDGISWTKGCFVGQEVLGRLDNFNKVARLCIGIRGTGGINKLGTPEQRAAARIVVNQSVVGKVSSVVAGTGEDWLGLALVKREAAMAQGATLRFAPDEEVQIQLEDRPFWLEAKA